MACVASRLLDQVQQHPPKRELTSVAQRPYRQLVQTRRVRRDLPAPLTGFAVTTPQLLRLELRTPPLPAAHVEVGTGHRTQARDYVIDATADPSFNASTRRTRPRVAPPERCSSTLLECDCRKAHSPRSGALFMSPTQHPGSRRVKARGLRHRRARDPRQRWHLDLWLASEVAGDLRPDPNQRLS